MLHRVVLFARSMEENLVLMNTHQYECYIMLMSTKGTAVRPAGRKYIATKQASIITHLQSRVLWKLRDITCCSEESLEENTLDE